MIVLSMLPSAAGNQQTVRKSGVTKVTVPRQYPQYTPVMSRNCDLFISTNLNTERHEKKYKKKIGLINFEAPDLVATSYEYD